MNFDASVNLDMTIRTVEDKTEDEINLNRVIYLLQFGELEKNAMFLLNYAYTVSKLSEYATMQQDKVSLTGKKKERN